MTQHFGTELAYILAKIRISHFIPFRIHKKTFFFILPVLHSQDDFVDDVARNGTP